MGSGSRTGGSWPATRASAASSQPRSSRPSRRGSSGLPLPPLRTNSSSTRETWSTSTSFTTMAGPSSSAPQAQPEWSRKHISTAPLLPLSPLSTRPSFDRRPVLYGSWHATPLHPTHHSTPHTTTLHHHTTPCRHPHYTIPTPTLVTLNVKTLGACKK